MYKRKAWANFRLPFYTLNARATRQFLNKSHIRADAKCVTPRTCSLTVNRFADDDASFSSCRSARMFSNFSGFNSFLPSVLHRSPAQSNPQINLNDDDDEQEAEKSKQSESAKKEEEGKKEKERKVNEVGNVSCTAEVIIYAT